MMKKISNFKNKEVLILGLAKSGESAARVLKALGAIVTVNDGKPFDENPAAQSLLAEGIKVITGEHPIGLLEEAFEVGLRLARHYLLYPNPWPKIGHLGRRWHAHPVFPTLLRLGGVLECRSNWRVYVEELAFALEQATGRAVPWEEFDAASPLTPFERKYRDSGQTLYRLAIDLDSADNRPPLSSGSSS